MTGNPGDNISDVSSAEAFTFATGKLNAAAMLSAAYRPDMIYSFNDGFIGTAYTAAHEALELLLKLYLRRGPIDVPPDKSHGHDLSKLFSAWDCVAREKAELKYHRDVLADLYQSRISRLTLSTPISRDTLGQGHKKNSPTVCEVLQELDVALTPRNITRLCPNYADVLQGFSYPPRVWYTEELLSLTWERFENACRQGESLGLIDIFLSREGAKEVFEGWRQAPWTRPPPRVFGCRRPIPGAAWACA